MTGTAAQRFVTVATVGEIPDGGVKVARLDDREIAIFHVAGRYYAMDDVCTHDGGPLAEGVLEDHVIECPRHGARFDVRTGVVLAMPATAPVPIYSVRIEGDAVQVAWS
ncbi:MAG: non-heme iron oxygenase ferredoxin subunit [Candidatus Eisenbacteria bacterium]|uniref:Non-heme iron oxygenase ferredoxin subunit n=1 Tax=Eiseniibacteriota bacterium TaxID=2212470 RepID=A0A9D6QN07_UNCEI|nr:non-heme iron oxygenase ferredoxin subunit [Candidatus Eisenbacteria bacterium]MBI3540293.1 non-heme iron oxygenase ferredoxin subunit [Candidatus Eisenbacteria bacterium]